MRRLFDYLLRPSASKTEVVDVRRSEPYQRLKARFVEGEQDVSSGFASDNLTVGDLVDILDLYLEMARGGTSGPYHHGLVPMLRAVNIDPDGRYTTELRKLNGASVRSRDLDRTNGLYECRVDLRKAIDEDRDELSHYPGGMIIREKLTERFSPTDTYELFLTNRQQATNNAPIVALFKELRLPVSY